MDNNAVTLQPASPATDDGAPPSGSPVLEHESQAMGFPSDPDSAIDPPETPSNFSPLAKYKKKKKKTGFVRAGRTVFAEQVFSNQDLVDAIIDHSPSVYDGGTMERRKWLRLLTMSRTLFEAISTHFWRELSSIIPLFSLLPQSEQGEHVLMRALKSEDLARWRMYARHVRVITFAPNRPPTSSPSFPSGQALAMFIAYQAATGDLLFPALRHIYFKDKLRAEELTCLTAVTPPSLQGLHLEATSSSKVGLTTALQLAAESIPQLRELAIRATIPLDTLWPSLKRLGALRTVSLLIPYAHNHVESFFSLPNLQAGTLALSPSPSSNINQAGGDVPNLQCKVYNKPEGREVELSGDLRSLVSAIPAAVRCRVTKLEVGSSMAAQGGSWDPEELLNIISISCSNVTTLCLRDEHDAYCVPLGSLWKVMALDNLQTLIFANLRVECNVLATQDRGPDQIFQHLCLSAKHKVVPLTTLHIHKLDGESLGLSSLRHVAEHLPHLLDLKLSLDSSLPFEPPWDPSKSDNAHLLPQLDQTHPLKTLYLGDLRSGTFQTQEYRPTAQLINFLFPDLDCLEASSVSSLKEGWTLIDGMRRDYQFMGKAIVGAMVVQT